MVEKLVSVEEIFTDEEIISAIKFAIEQTKADEEFYSSLNDIKMSLESFKTLDKKWKDKRYSNSKLKDNIGEDYEKLMKWMNKFFQNFIKAESMKKLFKPEEFSEVEYTLIYRSSRKQEQKFLFNAPHTSVTYDVFNKNLNLNIKTISKKVQKEFEEAGKEREVNTMNKILNDHLKG